MTDKELRKLSRDKLLELLLEQTLEVEKLQGEVENLKEKLQERNILIHRAGSIAEAALQLNNIFDVAQKAADQYLESVMNMSDKQEEICNRIMEECKAKAKALEQATLRKCTALEEETKAKCKKMLESTESQSNEYWDGVFSKLATYMDQRSDLQLAKPKKDDEEINAPKAEELKSKLSLRRNKKADK